MVVVVEVLVEVLVEVDVVVVLEDVVHRVSWYCVTPA